MPALLIAMAILMTVGQASGTAAGGRPFGVTVVAQSTATPTADPCVLEIQEAGAGVAVHMGHIAWAASETLNFCSNPEGSDAHAEFVMTAANGDQVVGRYASVVRLDPGTGVLTFTGDWEITGGTGRFQNAVGEGTLSGGGQLTSSTQAQLAATFVGTISY